MGNNLSFTAIIRRLDHNIEFTNFSEKELNAWNDVFEKHIDSLLIEGDEEDLAITNVYHLVFLLRSGRLQNDDDIQAYYTTVRRHFFEEESNYNKRWKDNTGPSERKILFNQMLYFFKLVEFYLVFIEKTFLSLNMDKYIPIVHQDIVHFLQKQRLLEGQIKKIFSYLRLSVSLFLEKYIFIYALLTVAGIVLMWHGLWGIYDWIIALSNMTDNIFSYIATTSLGIIILFVTGGFINQTIGEKMEEYELSEMEEIKNIDKFFDKENRISLPSHRPKPKKNR